MMLCRHVPISGGEGAEMRPVRMAAVFVQADPRVGSVRYRTGAGEQSATRTCMHHVIPGT